MTVTCQCSSGRQKLLQQVDMKQRTVSSTAKDIAPFISTLFQTRPFNCPARDRLL